MDLIAFSNLAVGVPFKEEGNNFNGWNCWGLIEAAYENVFGITLPDYSFGTAEDNAEQIDQGKEDDWIKVVGTERPGDVLILRNGRLACHVGLVIERGRMLHVQEKYGTTVERYNSPTIKRRVVGAYRYAKLSPDN